MVILDEKQISLCKAFHKKLYAELYDGPSLKVLRKQLTKNLDIERGFTGEPYAVKVARTVREQVFVFLKWMQEPSFIQHGQMIFYTFSH